MSQFVSRAGQKLEHALDTFALDVKGLIVADLGCNAGGFTDCLLQRGAAKVYAVDTGYGALDWKLRKDPRVVVMERTNAMHATLPEQVGLATIDVAWTRQRHILPAARRMLAGGGHVISLIKPHYEASAALLRRGVLPAEALDEVLAKVRADIAAAGFTEIKNAMSPIKGAKGNVEMLVLLRAESDLPGRADDALRAELGVAIGEADRGEFAEFTAEDVIAECRTALHDPSVDASDQS